MFSYWSWQILLQLCAGSSPGSRKLPLFLSSGRTLENKGRINTYKTLRASCCLQVAGSRGREWKKGFLSSWLSPQLTLAATNKIFASSSPGEPITSAACRALRLVGRLWGFVWFSRSSIVCHGALRGAQQLSCQAPGGAGAFVVLAAAAFWLPGERALELESSGEIKIWHPRPAAPAETLSSPPSACSVWLLGAELCTVRASTN